MYIDTLQMTDFKSFAATDELRLVHPRRAAAPAEADRPAPLPNVSVFIGENGAGKTSILKAICFGVLYETAPTLQIASVSNVRRAKPAPAAEAPDRATIVLGAVGEVAVGEAERFTHETEIVRLSPSVEKIRPVLRSGQSTVGTERGATFETIMARADDPAYFLVAYGADRQLELPENYDRGTRSRGRPARALRLASLLDPGPFTLVPLGSWLAGSPRRDEALRLLRSTLPDDGGVTPTADVEGKEVIFDDHGVRLPLSALSDGYRAFIGWVGDLLYHLVECAPDGQPLDGMAGVVLVDEVDLHLHPRWQQQVLERVARTFPRLQFVVTTHSPLIIGGLRKENVLAVRRQADGTSGVGPLKTEVWGRTPNQLLLDPIFGLEHTRDRDFMALLRRVEDRALGGDAQAARYLNALIAFERDPAAAHAVMDAVQAIEQQLLRA